MNYQFTDGSEHRVTAVAETEDGDSLREGQDDTGDSPGTVLACETAGTALFRRDDRRGFGCRPLDREKDPHHNSGYAEY
jgi:hypothetical protein